MPYIITTKRPCRTICACSGACISRRAVATLEDRERHDGTLELGVESVVANIIEGRVNAETARAWLEQTSMMPACGRVIGPLPDGTVIEVELLSHYQLCLRIPGRRLPDQTVQMHSLREDIAAYNEAQEGRGA